jgi:hypothetical protein
MKPIALPAAYGPSDLSDHNTQQQQQQQQQQHKHRTRRELQLRPLVSAFLFFF